MGHLRRSPREAIVVRCRSTLRRCKLPASRAIPAQALLLAGAVAAPRVASGYCTDYSPYTHVIGSVNTPSSAWAVARAGAFAYVADYAAGVQIYDVSDPTSPSLRGSVDTPGTAYDLEVSGGLFGGLSLALHSVRGGPAPAPWTRVRRRYESRLFGLRNSTVYNDRTQDRRDGRMVRPAGRPIDRKGSPVFHTPSPLRCLVASLVVAAGLGSAGSESLAGPPGSWPGCGVPIIEQPGFERPVSMVVDLAGGVFMTTVDVGTGICLVHHFDSNGNVAAGWPAGGVQPPAMGGVVNARVVLDGADGVMVVWEDDRSHPGFNYDVYATRFTSTGTMAPGWHPNGNGLHPTTPPIDDMIHDVESGGGGTMYVAYGPVFDETMMVTRYLAAGHQDFSWPPDGITLAGGYGGRLASDGAGGVYVLYYTSTGLRLLRVMSTGAPFPGWGATGIALASTFSWYDLDVQEDGSGVSVGWIDGAQAVRLAIVSPSGVLAAGFPVVLSTTTNPKTLFNLANGGPAGGAVVAWREDLPEPDGFKVFIHRRTATGAVAPGWLAGGLETIADGGQLQAFPDDNSGTTFVYHYNGQRALRINQTGALVPGWPAGGTLLCGGGYRTLFISPPPESGIPDGTGGAFVFQLRIPGTAVAPFDSSDAHLMCVRGHGIVHSGYIGLPAAGANSSLELGPMSLSFANVTTPGETRLDILDGGPPPPFGFQIVPNNSPLYYDVTTEASWTPPVQVCIDYDPATLTGPEQNLKLWHWDTSAAPPVWEDVTSTIDTDLNVICGTSTSLSPFILTETNPTDIAEGLPRVSQLLANVPNPFNPTTSIRFELARDEQVRLEVLDVRGRLVRRLVNDSVRAGRHEAMWDGRNERGRPVASGVYCYRITTPSFTDTRRMVLVK
jgi:hypothetical protein